MDDSKEISKTIRFGKTPLASSPFTSGGKVLGIIESYNDNTKTYTVVTQGNKRNPNALGGRLQGIPRKLTHAGDQVVLSPETTVIVDFELGIPYIDGVLPQTATAAATYSVAPNFGASPGSGASTAADTGGNYRTANAPTGMLPGDQVLAGEDGNYVAALRGKISTLHGSERAQVLVSGLHDLVRVVCENYENFSSFGNLEVKNKDGRSSLSFRGGSDQASQTGGELEAWTFRLDIGDVGNIFDMRVTSPDNSKTFARIKMSPDGFMEIFGELARADSTAGDRYTTTGGSHYVRTSGNHKEDVRGTVSKNFQNSLVENVASTRTSNVGMDDVSSINRNELKNIGAQQLTTVMGGLPLDAKPTDKAKEVRVVNGSYVIEIGSPKDGGVPSAMSGYKVYVHNGAIIIGENPMLPATQCSVNLSTLKPSSIGLGCIVPGPWPEAAMNPPTGSAMVYEKWLILFNALITALDNHQHVATYGGGPTLSTLPGTPGAYFQGITSSLTAAVKSLKVKIGA
jgi:hypothetical protein